MSLSESFRRKRQEIQSERERLAIERAQFSAKKLMESEQFRLSALALPESEMAVDAIIRNTVQTCLDPASDFVDTLRAKGFRQAEIRATVHNLYITYFCGINRDKADTTPYEEMLKSVSLYVSEHQEVYNTLSPDTLRDE